MLKKDTAKYRDLVYQYCQARSSVEFQQKDIDKNLKTLGKAKNHYDFLSNTPILDDEIKEWYNGYTSVLNMVINLSKSNQRYDKERMEKYGSILKEDYEEDLDLLYEIHKKK